MRLFKAPDKTRVRITSRLIRWVEHGAERPIAEEVTWEGTVTDRYYYYKGARRRLVVNHTVEFWDEYGVWQKDCECEIIPAPNGKPRQRGISRRNGVLIDT
jgi:hypothetical protein